MKPPETRFVEMMEKKIAHYERSAMDNAITDPIYSMSCDFTRKGLRIALDYFKTLPWEDRTDG